MSEDVLVTIADGVIEVTINRPHARNAMSRSAAEAIAAAMDRLDADDALRCAIITGAGGTFCAGMDLKGFVAGEVPMIGDRGFAGMTDWTPVKPVIAAVDGYAVAGGMELALACDLIVAHVDAQFGIPEVKRGLIAAAGGLARLSRVVPRPLAMDMALTGEPIGARRAYELGLVSRLSEGPAIEAARELAAAIAVNSPLAVAESKQVIRESWTWPEDEFAQRQAPFIARITTSPDALEGARAFAEKRKPQWRAR